MITEAGFYLPSSVAEVTAGPLAGTVGASAVADSHEWAAKRPLNSHCRVRLETSPFQKRGQRLLCDLVAFFFSFPLSP